MKHFFNFCATLVIILCLSCTKEDVNTSVLDNQSRFLPVIESNSINDFFITEDVLNEYLKLKNKLSNVTEIIPLKIENEILVYFVQYNKGWDIISADTRIESILASSDSSDDIILNASVLEQQFLGVLEYVQSVKVADDRTPSRLWSYLQLKVLSRSSINTKSPVARGMVAGMWIEITEEPVYSEEEIVIPHIIVARWKQGAPWNKFMPKSNSNSNYAVGCGPVACGQVIHHFRKNNPKGITIPTTATFANETGNGQYPSFSNFSTCHWDLLGVDLFSPQTNINYSSIFLSYLGQQIGVSLSSEVTSTTHSQMRNALNLYQFQFKEASSYNYQNIYLDLINGRPVIVGSEFNRVDSNNTEIANSYHYYIIDRYKERSYLLTTTYQWVPDYQPTEWELQTLPQWRFEDFWADGRDIMDVTISRTEDTYFGMNWGEDSYMDNFYLVRSYTSESEDEAGIIPSTETFYTPMWRVNTNSIDNNGNVMYNAKNVSSVFYNIKD